MTLFTINKDVLFYQHYEKLVTTHVIFRQLRFSWLKALRQLHLKSKLPLVSIWFSRDFKRCGLKDSEVIIFDSILTTPAANYIKRKYPQLRVVYWFWNHIYNSALYDNLLPNIEKWSYDKADCCKYQMKYNTQFHFSKLLKPVEKEQIDQDFFFIGAEKGRSNFIHECERVIDANNLTKKFIVIGNTRQDRISNWMPYEQVVENIKHSRCIVDLMPDAQNGLTLRPLEALFLKKKLITNFSQIRDYDFYNSDNIFILGVDKAADLAAFLDMPYNNCVDKYIEKYDFNSWLSRFDKTKNRIL